MSAERKTPLAKARSRAVRVRSAGDQLRATWGDLRRRLTIASVILPGLPLAVVMARLGENSIQFDPSVLGLAALVGAPVLTNLVLRVVERLQRLRHGPDTAYQAVLDKCVELDPMPAPIDAALDQALEAYFSLRKLGEEPDWKRVGFPMEDHLQRASVRVVELLEWGRRLAIIGDRLEKTRGEARETPEFRDTRTQYLAQCAQIAAAASAFSRVEAKVTLAYAALSASAARDSVAAGQLQELTATFDALTEVLSESEAGARINVPLSEEPQVVIQRQ